MLDAPLNVDELAVVFGFRNKRGVNRAVRLGTFPIPTYTNHEGRRFAHPDHVNDWMMKKKAKAEVDFNEWDR